MRRPLPLAVVVGAMLPVVLFAQTPPQPSVPGPRSSGPPRDTQTEKVGTAVLSGRVVDAESGKPLRRALVRAMSQDAPQQPRMVSTDADGRWQLKALPAGSYRISVSKGGFVEMAYGQKRPFETGKPLDVADGQAIDKIDVGLPHAGVITGQVVDEFGEPITGARVTPMRYRYVGGQRRLLPMGPGDMTDDVGQYRLHGLTPGEYYVSASMSAMLMFGQSDDRLGYAPTFYPGTAAASEAQRVAVTVGQETSQINIAMARARIATISGKAVSSSGAPIYRGMLMLMSLGAGSTPGMMMGAPLKPDGTFLFSNVAPGDYRIQVQHSPNSDEPIITPQSATEIGIMPVTVTDRDITDLVITTRTGAKASGRIVFEGAATPPVTAQTINLTTMSTDYAVMMPSSPARVREDGTFEMSGLYERRRFRVTNTPPGWFLKAVTQDGNDVTDSGIEFKEGQNVADLEIVLTQRVTEISGVVQDARSQPVTDYVVVAFSSDRRKWDFQTRFIRSARPNQEGRFSIKGLPPDEYQVVALDYLEAGEENDPEQLEKWKSMATRVTLGDRESKTLTLKLAQ